MPWGIVRNTNNYCAGLRDKLSSIPAWLFGVFWEPTAAHGGEHVSVFRTALPPLSVSGRCCGQSSVLGGTPPTVTFSCHVG